MTASEKHIVQNQSLTQPDKKTPVSTLRCVTMCYSVCVCLCVCVHAGTSQSLLQILQNDPDQLDHRYNQSPKCQRAGVEPAEASREHVKMVYEAAPFHGSTDSPLTPPDPPARLLT